MLYDRVPRVSSEEELFEYELPDLADWTSSDDIVEDFTIAVARVTVLFIDIGRHDKVNRQKLEQLDDDTSWISSILQYSQFSTLLYKRISGSEPTEHYQYEPIFDRYIFRDRYRQWASESLTGTVFNKYDNQISLLDGSNLYSIEILFRHTGSEVGDIHRKSQNSSMYYSPMLKNISIMAFIYPLLDFSYRYYL